ncbi:MAG: hypothetical protein ACI4SY_06470 [Sutterella sp.]
MKCEWTLEEAPTAEFVRSEMLKAAAVLETGASAGAGRDEIRVRVFRAVLAGEKLLRLMAETEARMLGTGGCRTPAVNPADCFGRLGGIGGAGHLPN